ncbi:hypothetical protein KIPB_011516, partial [Kipferlia bialata]
AKFAQLAGGKAPTQTKQRQQPKGKGGRERERERETKGASRGQTQREAAPEAEQAMPPGLSGDFLAFTDSEAVPIEDKRQKKGGALPPEPVRHLKETLTLSWKGKKALDKQRWLIPTLQAEHPAIQIDTSVSVTDKGQAQKGKRHGRGGKGQGGATTTLTVSSSDQAQLTEVMAQLHRHLVLPEARPTHFLCIPMWGEPQPPLSLSLPVPEAETKGAGGVKGVGTESYEGEYEGEEAMAAQRARQRGHDGTSDICESFAK